MGGEINANLTLNIQVAPETDQSGSTTTTTTTRKSSTTTLTSTTVKRKKSVILQCSVTGETDVKLLGPRTARAFPPQPRIASPGSPWKRRPRKSDPTRP